MHFAFIPYGNRDRVEAMLRDMEAQKHRIKLWKGNKKKELWIPGSLRMLPCGIYEYIFPKEDYDKVLNTMIRIVYDRYSLGNLKLGMLRKIFKLKKIPKYEKGKCYLWVKDHVNIIPLGIRMDTEITDHEGENEGWTHEAI